MIAVTPDIIAQLVRTKHVSSIARTLASKSDAANRIITTILLDYAAESVLKTVYWSHPTTAPKAKELSFPELLRTVAGLADTPSSFPLQQEILNLHAQRGLTQHRNLTPSDEDVSRHAAYVEAFLRDLSRRFFELDFDALSLTQLVENDELRAQLGTAEASLAQGDFRASVEEAASALHKATMVTANVVGITTHRWRAASAFSGSRRAFTAEQQRVVESILRSIEQLASEVEGTLRALIAGVDWATYMKYRAVAPRAVWSFDGSIGVIHKADEYSEDEARVVFDHALTQILRLQDMGALAAPLPPGISSSSPRQ